MFKYKFYEFFNKENEVLTIQFENSKFLIGEFFTESSLINLCSYINSKIITDKNFNNMIDWSFFPFNINNSTNENNDLKYIKEIFSNLKVIIITNFRSIFGYILIYKLIMDNEDIFQMNKESLNKIMIYSTEPIIQFAQCYLNEFYSSFNSLLINYAIKNNSTNENEFQNKKVNFINNNDIDYFLNHIISINYNEKINYLVPLSSNSNSLLNSNETSSLIEKYISFELCCNEYELGSSNILFHYFNKNIFIMTKSSNYNNRYPKIFDSNSPKNCDFLLIFPEVINNNKNILTSYEDNYKRLLETLMKSNTYESSDTKNVHFYPYTLILTDPFFMLEFCDVFKYKLKPAKTVYFSKAMKSIFKYSNVSLGFLNDNLVNKIYGFNMPFSFGDLEKEKNLIIYNDVIELQNQLINIINNNIRDDTNINNTSFNNLFNFGINQNTYYNKKGRKAAKDDNETNYEINKEIIKNLIERSSPFCFISHYFSLYNENNKEVLDFFMNNYDTKYDKIIIVSNNSDFYNNIFLEIKSKLNLNSVNIENFVLDYRLDTDKLNQIIKTINPKFQLSNDINGEYQEINMINSDIYADYNISYNNSYLLSNNNKGILNQLSNNSELNINISREQLRYNIILDSKENKNISNNNSEVKDKRSKKKKGTEKKEENNNMIIEEIDTSDNNNIASLEESEDILNKYLEMNDMEITEYLKNENNIEISIYNKTKKTDTVIKINNYYQENKDSKEKDKKGKSSKSKSSKKNKGKEKESDKMEIEEKDNLKEIETSDNSPSIDISCDDADDSLFLNTLFNSIFI